MDPHWFLAAAIWLWHVCLVANNFACLFTAKCTTPRPPTNGFTIQTETKYGPAYIFGCDRGYNLPPKYPNKSFCRDGKWVPAIPENCISAKACAPIAPRISQVLSDCSTNGLGKICNETVDVGSTVTKTCKEGYENRSPIVHTCQRNGEWSPPITKCNPICGRTTVSHIPWLVKIMIDSATKVFEIAHSGVIVSERVILTYAKGNFSILTDDISVFHVFAGSLSYSYLAGEVLQKRRIVERFIVPNPIDANDRTFVVLIVDEPFDFSSNIVGPVCMDFLKTFSHTNNGAPIGETGSLGTFVYNWLYLMQYFYKILDNSECKSSDENFARELTTGKMCARRGISRECAMVVGTGLVIPKNENGESVHYLRGIATTGFSEAETIWCVLDEFQLFVNIYYYQVEIQRYIMEYD